MIPHDNNAEMSVLGAAMQDKAAADAACEQLTADDFYMPDHAEIFGAIYELYTENKPIDLVTVGCKVVSNVCAAKVSEALRSTPSFSNYAHYIGIVKEYAVRRRLIKLAGKVIKAAEKGEDTAENLVARTEKAVYDMAQKTTNGEIKKLDGKAWDVLSRLGEEGRSIKTGFADVDYKTGGLSRGDLIILAGRPGMGKTAFALNIATNAAQNGASVVIFSLEMLLDSIMLRLASSTAKVNLKQISDDAEAQKLTNGLLDVEKLSIAIDDAGGTTLQQIRSKLIRYKLRNPLDLVIIDHLQNMGYAGKAISETQRLTEITVGTKALAKELDIPILLLSQLNRENVKRASKLPCLADLRGSGSIEQDADIVMALHREAAYEEAAKTERAEEYAQPADLLILKNRNGETGAVRLEWLAGITRFYSSGRWYT